MFRPTESLTVKNAKIARETGLQAIAAGQTIIDLADLTAVDSVAVATLLTWQRAAAELGAVLTFTNPPANLQSLVKVYGVANLLCLDSSTGAPTEPRSDHETTLGQC